MPNLTSLTRRSILATFSTVHRDFNLLNLEASFDVEQQTVAVFPRNTKKLSSAFTE
jgi:hypothetical protein